MTRFMNGPQNFSTISLYKLIPLCGQSDFYLSASSHRNGIKKQEGTANKNLQTIFQIVKDKIHLQEKEWKWDANIVKSLAPHIIKKTQHAPRTFLY